MTSSGFHSLQGTRYHLGAMVLNSVLSRCVLLDECVCLPSRPDWCVRTAGFHDVLTQHGENSTKEQTLPLLYFGTPTSRALMSRLVRSCCQLRWVPSSHTIFCSPSHIRSCPELVQLSYFAVTLLFTWPLRLQLSFLQPGWSLETCSLIPLMQ